MRGHVISWAVILPLILVQVSKAREAQQRSCGERTCYNVLGVSSSANENEIKRAYRALARKCKCRVPSLTVPLSSGMAAGHPDKNPNNAEEAQSRFTDISNANEILTTEREEYNHFLRYGSQQRQQHFGFHQGNRHWHHQQQQQQRYRQQQHYRQQQQQATGSVLLFILPLLVAGYFAATALGLFTDENESKATSCKAAHEQPRYDRLLNGTRVIAHGLKAKPELNGKRGKVVRFDATTSRYIVQMDQVEGVKQHLTGLRFNSLQQIVCNAVLLEGALRSEHSCRVVGSHAKDSGSWDYLVELRSQPECPPLTVQPDHVRLPDNTRVVVVALKSQPALNGTVGTICSWDDAGQRYFIRFQDGTKIALKPTSCRI